MKEDIRKLLLDSGAVAVGFAMAGEIDSAVHEDYVKWIGEGYNADMDYLKRHIPLRHHTDHVLPGAKTVISLAYDYYPEKFLPPENASISAYAYGDDYHGALREILSPLVKDLQKKLGGEWRICIDSAPVAERYWAMKSGIGRRGVNSSVIIAGAGAFCFLVEILTTLSIPPDKPSDAFCDNCGECIRKCPGKALRGDGTMDARRCINYLTIEKKGEFSPEEEKLVSEGSGYLFGCDVCLRVCPHNKDIIHTKYASFSLNDEIKNLTPEKILSLESQEFKDKFKNTPLGYGGLKRLRRNASLLISKK